MSYQDLFFVVFTVLGGLALFIFGMNVMTEGLRLAVGAKLQRLLGKTTRSVFGGFSLGTGLGATIHSSAGTVMLVGFVNAGLLTLEQSIAPMLGANFGTTLSMQAISFDLSDYSYVAITVGLVVSLLSSTPKGKYIGRSVLGFGLLFLGMDTMSGAISPHREALSAFLQGIDGDTYSGLFLGVLMAAGLTAVWQSSGATIAITFAMITAGVFTQFSQIFPIVLGAHLGTCATSLLGSLGTNIEARRCAVSHLLFNIFNVLLAIALQSLFYRLIPLTSVDLVRQTANLHTAVMLLAAVIILPFTHAYARLVRMLAFRNRPMPQSSFLDYQLLEYPERGIVAVIAELQRVAQVCAQSLALVGRVILHNHNRRIIAKLKKNEQVVNDVKITIREYILTMSKKYLSRRQIIIYHYLNHCMADIERIGDHIDQLCDMSLKRPPSSLDKESMDALFVLYEKAQHLLLLMIKSMNPERKKFQSSAKVILKARDDYTESSVAAKEIFMKKVKKHELSPAAAFYFKEYIVILDRMSRHIKNIAVAQKHEDFWIKESKLDKKTEQLEKDKFHSVDLHDYLDSLPSDEV